VLTYSKTSADRGMERCDRLPYFDHISLSSLSLSHTHTHTHTFISPEHKSGHISLLEGGEAVLDLCGVLLGCVIGILLSPTVQSCLKVLSKSAYTLEVGRSKGWINAAWTI
jgi:hypothetical protein